MTLIASKSNIAGFLIIILLVLEFNTNAQFALNMKTAMVGTGTKSSRTLDNFETTTQFSKYGGCLTKRVDENGFFKLAKVDNVWYIADPEGYLFISSGVNSVNKGGGFSLPDSLKKISCNTMACWSDETINAGTNKIAYTPRWNMLLNYKNTTQRTKDLYALGIIPVFDGAFATYCMNLAATSIAPLKNDPYILGHFSDNELPLYDNSTYGNLLDRFLAITNKADANYIAADNWMKARSGVGYTIIAADRLEFHGYVAGTYYRIVSTAIKQYDPNHLYIGSRLHGAAKSIAPIFREAGKYVDIITINVYNIWTPTTADMDMWTNESGRPFMVSEFYAKAEDALLDNVAGAGWLVKTQADRALFFENFTLALLGHKGSVGYHHFKYQDDEANRGLINSYYKWYAPLKESFNKIGKDIYTLRDFLIYGYVGDGIATVYTGLNYELQARLLKEGNYYASDLLAMGIDSKTIASLKVKPNCVVTLYSGNDFTGDSTVITSNINDLTALAFINKTGSLRIVDNNITGVKDIANNTNQIDVYPNPFSGSISVDCQSVKSNIQISIYTLAGKLVKKANVNSQQNTIDTGFIKPGIYLLKLEGKDISMTSKILKTH